MHKTAPDLEKEFDTLFAQNIVIYSQTLRLIHYQFFFHVSFYQFYELVVKDVFVLRVLFVFFIFTN